MARKGRFVVGLVGRVGPRKEGLTEPRRTGGARRNRSGGSGGNPPPGARPALLGEDPRHRQGFGEHIGKHNRCQARTGFHNIGYCTLFVMSSFCLHSKRKEIDMGAISMHFNNFE